MNHPGDFSRRRSEGGFAVMGVLILVTMMLALTAVASRRAQVEVRIAGSELLAAQSLAVAEAGLAHAFMRIRQDGTSITNELTSGGAGGGLVSIGSVASLFGGSYRFAEFGGVTGDGYYVHVEDNFDETVGANDATVDKDGVVEIVSIGRVRGAERIVRASLIRDPAIGSFFGRLGVTIEGGARVDSYDSGSGAYSILTSGSHGDVASNGDVVLHGTTTVVHGDATAGGAVSTSGGATVSGTKTSGAAAVTFDPVTPCGPPYYNGAGITGTSWSYNSTTGELNATGGGNIILPSGTFCLGTVTLSGSSTLTVTGPVALHLTGSSKLSGGGVQNTTHIPAQLKIFSSDTDTLAITGGSGAYMSVYAPNADVHITGGSDLYGGIVGKSITNSGGTSMHADAALNDTTFRLASWREVRRR